MKRLLIILAIVVPLALGALAVTTWAFGSMTEKGVQSYVAGEPLPLGNGALSLKLRNYERSFLRSAAATDVTVAMDEETVIPLHHEIFHGPLAATPDGIHAGMGYVITTLDREALPANLREKVARLYEDGEPFRIITRIPFAGGRTVEGEVAAVDLDESDLEVRFDGTRGRLQFDSDGNPVEGNLEVSPLRANWSDVEGAHRVRMDGAEVTLDPGQSPELQGTLGEMAVSNTTAGGDSPFAMETAASRIESDQRFAEGHPDLPLGSYHFSMPEISLDFGAAGPMTLAELSVTSESDLADDMFSGALSYEIGSVEWDAGDALRPYQPLWRDGVSLSFAGRFPPEVARQFATIRRAARAISSDEGGDAERTTAFADAFAEAFETAADNVTGGTRLGMDLEFGTGSHRGALDLSAAYTGEEPITSQNTYLELVRNTDVRIEAAIPKSFAAAAPSIRKTLAPLIAAGALMETPEGLRLEAILEDGKLITNGKENPLFRQMAPLMMGRIQWDRIFASMRPDGEPEKTQ